MLYADAHFIRESPEYVLNQLVESVLAKDKEFVASRPQHLDSYLPLSVHQCRKQKQAMQVVVHGRRASQHRPLSVDRSEEKGSR
jgi:hypothetical protein